MLCVTSLTVSSLIRSTPTVDRRERDWRGLTQMRIKDTNWSAQQCADVAGNGLFQFEQYTGRAISVDG
jgi:hypothetical protein